MYLFRETNELELLPHAAQPEKRVAVIASQVWPGFRAIHGRFGRTWWSVCFLTFSCFLLSFFNYAKFPELVRRGLAA